MLEAPIRQLAPTAPQVAVGGEQWLRPVAALLLLLLAADVAFAALHVASGYGLTRSSRLFRLGSDRSYAEVYQYVKLFWAALYALGLAFARRPASVYGACALLFAYLLADDAFMVHERLGATFAAGLAFRDAAGVRAQDFGELLATGIAATALLGVLLVSCVRAPRAQRAFAAGVLAWVAVLAAFGVAIDVAHVALGHSAGRTTGGVWWELVEDGGEMAAVSGLLVFVIAHGARRRFPGSERLRRALKWR